MYSPSFSAFKNGPYVVSITGFPIVTHYLLALVVHITGEKAM